MLRNLVKSVVQAHQGDDRPVITSEVKSTLSEFGIFNPLAADSPIREAAHGDQASIEKTYENIVWVFRCIDLIATNVANLPGKVISRRGDDVVDISDRPEFIPLLNPNNFQSAFDFYYESIARLRLQGEMFWELQFLNELSDTIVAMYCDWASHEVEVLPDPETFIGGYERHVDGKTISYDAREVFYLKYFNPFSTLRGITPLRAARSSMVLDLNSAEFAKNSFEHGMRFQGVFTTEQPIGADEAKRMMKVLEEEWGGLKNLHKNPVLWGGVKFNQVNNALAMDDWVKLREMTREEICIAQGVPLESIGLGQKTYENLPAANKLLWTTTLLPTCKKLVDLINLKLIPRLTNDPSAEYVLDKSEVEALREDRSALVTDYKEGIANGALTPNDMRVDVYNKEPDDSEESNSFYMSNSLRPIDEPAPGASVIDESGKATVNVLEHINKLIVDNYSHLADRSMMLGTKADETTDAGREEIWRQKIQKIEANEITFQRGMTTFLDRQAGVVTAWIRDNMKRSKSGKVLTVSGKVTTEPIIIQSDAIFDVAFWESELAKFGDPLILGAFIDGIIEVMNIDSFDLNHPAATTGLANRTENFSIRVNRTTNEAIKRELSAGFEANETIDQIADRVNERVFGSHNLIRARRIARTEIVGATNHGIMEGIRQSPAFSKKMWITSRDDRVRDSHVSMDGIVRNNDETFILEDGKEMPFPQEVNERCIIIPTIEARTTE